MTYIEAAGVLKFGESAAGGVFEVNVDSSDICQLMHVADLLFAARYVFLGYWTQEPGSFSAPRANIETK